MVQINLLPDIKIVYLKVRRLRLIVFLVALFVITICTIVLLLMALTALVGQKNDIISFEKKINGYVGRFNGEGGEDIRKYLAIQDKFESLGLLKEEKIDINRLWDHGLFQGNGQSFLPDKYLNQIELYNFDFETGEFTIAGSVEEGGEDINFRDHFYFAYYEIGQTDEAGQTTWGCPLAPTGGLDDSPAWTYCRMFSDIQANSEFNPELGAERKINISGLFTVEVGNGINLFDRNVEMRVRVPVGCSDIACVSQPGLEEGVPQEFALPGPSPQIDQP